MLKCKVYAPPKKKRILLCQEDKELQSMLTNDPMEAQIHVVPLRDIRADVCIELSCFSLSKTQVSRSYRSCPSTWKSTSHILIL